MKKARVYKICFCAFFRFFLGLYRVRDWDLEFEFMYFDFMVWMNLLLP